MAAWHFLELPESATIRAQRLCVRVFFVRMSEEASARPTMHYSPPPEGLNSSLSEKAICSIYAEPTRSSQFCNMLWEKDVNDNKST